MAAPPETHRRAPDRAARVRTIALIHRDNTYGTPEEDAFRRDFTVNALFYDIGTFSIIDYVGGLEDLDARVDPLHRRSGGAVPRGSRAHAARGGPRGAPAVHHRRSPSSRRSQVHRHEIARSAPARLIEEFYKILRSGHAEEALRQLRATGLLKAITPELARGCRGAVASIARARSLSRTVRSGARDADQRDSRRHAAAPAGPGSARSASRADPLERRVELGMLPIATARRRTSAADPRPPAAPARHRRRRCARSARFCTARC